MLATNLKENILFFAGIYEIISWFINDLDELENIKDAIVISLLMITMIWLIYKKGFNVSKAQKKYPRLTYLLTNLGVPACVSIIFALVLLLGQILFNISEETRMNILVLRFVIVYPTFIVSCIVAAKQIFDYEKQL